MNVYDFDKTIFYPDSSVTFCTYCYKKFPVYGLKRALPGAYYGIKYKLNRDNVQKLKETMFSFLSEVSDVDALVAEFWEQNFYRVQAWYLTQKRPDDLIISASPEFLVRPATDRLGVRLIGTQMDKNTGRFLGKNCYHAEKVLRYRAEFGEQRVDEFYSDSLSDSPMAQIAQKAFLVTKGRLSPWPKEE